MYTLATLLQEIVVDKLVGDPSVPVQSISFDTRIVSEGALFVALRGTKVDGHDYIQDAVAAGSAVVVCERIPDALANHVTYVVVTDSAKALGILAANFFGRPSTQLKLVGVTGTNGKTSTVHALFGLFSRLGYRVGMLSTIYNAIHKDTFPATLTTPDPIQLNAFLARMVQQGCQYCFMEVSSHAIVQQRITGVQFAGAVFLNITHDHLDYHRTFSAYIQAKKTLFDALPANAFALFNTDDKHGKIMVQNTKASTYNFSLKTHAHFMAKLLTNTLQGLELYIAHRTTWFQLVGMFNAYNLLAAYATARLLGKDSHEVLIALSALPPVLGRFQYIPVQAGFGAIIDYAHTPDALKNVLMTIDQLKSKAGNIITVLGCGGDRDKQKRPVMAQVALRFSHLVIFTADNPRNEVPQAIIRDMQAGMTPAQQQQTLSIVDRAEAIKTACKLAKSQDIVLIAGKGHEDYQEIKGTRYPFDDKKVLIDSIR